MKKVIMTLVLITSVLSLYACSNKALETAQTAVTAYNQAVKAFNESVSLYNEAVELTVDANQRLDDAIDSAQATINAGEEPYDTETLTLLKAEISAAQEAKVDSPEPFSAYDVMTINENTKRDDLKALAEKATADTATIKTIEIPESPTVPDYAYQISAITEAQQIYEDSIQSLKQVTAPSDDFVIDRLQTIDTIIEIEAVTEDHDPNGKLNKQGGYIGCIYFSDSQVDKSQLYIESGKDNVIDIGTDGGGAIEIFANVEDANKRNDYLAAFDGTIFASGGHYIIGTIIIRTSDELTGTKQLELTEKITNALIEVKH